jgi:hypothetical protein
MLSTRSTVSIIGQVNMQELATYHPHDIAQQDIAVIPLAVEECVTGHPSPCHFVNKAQLLSRPAPRKPGCELASMYCPVI